MILGMTRAELGLTVFVFLLIYGAGFLSRLGKVIGGIGFEGAPAGELPRDSEAGPISSTSLSDSDETK